MIPFSHFPGNQKQLPRKTVLRPSYEIWHDPLGYIVLAICLLLIWGFARLVSGPIPNVRPSKESMPVPFPWRLACGLGVWILFTVLGTEVWYRMHETAANAPLVHRMAGRAKGLFRFVDSPTCRRYAEI